MFTRIRSLIARVFENEIIRRIARNSSYLFSASTIGMFQSILAGRLLGPAMFGTLGAFTQFTSVLNRLTSFRIGELVVRYVGHYEEQDDHPRAAAVFKLAAGMEIGGSFLAFGLIWWLAPLGAEYFVHDPELTPLFRLYGAVVLANLMFESASGLLEIFDRFKVIAFANIFQSILTFSLILAAFLSKAGLYQVVLAYMIGKVSGSVLISAFAILQARRAWGAGWWKSPLGLLVDQRRSLMAFAFSTNLSSTISLVAKDSESLWISAFLGTEQAGYYKVAQALSNILIFPVTPLYKTTYPELAREIARKKWNNVRYILRQGSRLAIAYSAPVILGLVVFGKWIITLTYSQAYLPAYPALLWLLVGYAFVNFFYWHRVALLALARPIFPTIVNFFGMVIKVSLIFLLVPQFGYLAFAGLLSGYYVFTIGFSVARVLMDLKGRTEEQEPPVLGSNKGM